MQVDRLFTNSNPNEIFALLHSVFQNATDGILVIDTRGLIEAVNPAAAVLFQYKPSEIIGKNINFLMPEPYHSKHDDYLNSYVTTGEKKIIGIGREVKGKRKDGTVFPFHLSVSEVTMSDRILFTGVIHDVSDLKIAETKLKEFNAKLESIVAERTEELSDVVNRLLSTNKQLAHEVRERKAAEKALREQEQELRKAYEKERELGELKSRFVSMASHEFRTPLSTILSSAALLSRYTQTEQQDKREKHTNRIKSAVNNLTGILNDFLSLSKLEEGKIEVNFVLFSWNEFCDEVLDEMEGLLKDGQRIEHQPVEGDIQVLLDKRILKNILYNLFSNAIKYSPEWKVIFCRNTVVNKQLIIEIEDHGMGIPEEEQQYLFTRFFRARNVDNIKGTGLGLTIVKRYVELLNGSIAFKSEEGKGTTFKVRLPIEEEML